MYLVKEHEMRELEKLTMQTYLIPSLVHSVNK